MKNNRHFTDALFEEFDFFNDEVDSVLTEDLDTMLNYYKNLQNWDKQELLKFLSKDPTWNNDKEQGQYSKWILDKLNRNLLNNSHLGHLHDVLKRFEDNKKYLKNKDINKFKSVQEIDTYLNDDNNYNDLSHSQIVRQHRRDKQNVDLGNEAELIYEDSNWEIWIPKTYAASCKLGQGSKWCTASTETSEYFDDYSREGDLYIILNKHNEKEKYQFHVESDSYMDINDNEIDLIELIEKENNEKWISALRYHDEYFDEQCEDVIKEKEVWEKLNDFSQKINSFELIKYPAQKDIIEEFKELIYADDGDDERFLEYTDNIKTKNISIEIEDSVEKLESSAFKTISWIDKVLFGKNSKLKSIGDEAFLCCSNIRELELPNSLTSIGMDAFFGCESLTNVILPDSVTNIGNGAFSYCGSLANITIPEGVTNIGRRAFYNCRSLTTIIIPKSVTRIEDHTFAFCSKLTNIIIPEGVTHIDDNAFYDCDNLASITLPNSITSISKSAFERCQNLEIKTSNPYVIQYCITNDIDFDYEEKD